jgi:hypothetical protein
VAKNYTFRPAVREEIPCIIGLAGPSKSGKTYSAFRIARGMANGGTVAMINTEGPKGHMYLSKFPGYQSCEIQGDYSPEEYRGAIEALQVIKPAVVIIDSMSHCHEGPGGVLEWHERELDRMAGNDFKKRDRMTFAAWVKPKQAETLMINALLQLKCHVIMCFRAKEKLKITKGKDPENMGWQPIISERLPFETLTMFILPPFCKGVPDLSANGSESREGIPMPKPGAVLDEAYGKMLADWANGRVAGSGPALITLEQRKEIVAEMGDTVKPSELLARFGVKSTSEILASQLADVLAWVQQQRESHGATCPECGEIMTDGHCYTSTCPLGEPPD